MSSEFGTGKTVFVLAIVVGCFAVLWPKIFYPMLTASVKPTSPSRQVSVGWEEENSYFLSQLCFLVEQQQELSTPVVDFDCVQVVDSLCQVQISESVIDDYRQEKDSTNLTECLQGRFSLSRAVVAAAAPPRVRAKTYESKHVRPERPAHLYPEMMHPALREKGRALPQRTIEKQARPGPMPGVRPPMGGAGGMIPPSQGNKGSGAMGVIMPLYTVGIIIFFVYTIMKVLFKKGNEDTAPKLKDFHLDPEYRKYVFAEEYMDKSNASFRQQVRRRERDDSRGARKRFNEPDTKIEDEQMTQLRRRLEETEKAMERLMDQMGTVTDKLTAAKITEVLTQAQAQAKILKDQVSQVNDVTSDDDLTTSDVLTTTMSDEDLSFSLALERELRELQSEEDAKTSREGSSPDMDDYEVINKEDDDPKLTKKELATSGEEEATQGKREVEEAPRSGLLPPCDADESLQETRQENTSAAATTTTTGTGHEEDGSHDIDHDEEEETNVQEGQGSEEEATPLQNAASSAGSEVQEIPLTERSPGVSGSKEDEEEEEEEDPVTTQATTAAATAAAAAAAASAATVSQVAEDTEEDENEEGSTKRPSRSTDDGVEEEEEEEG